MNVVRSIACALGLALLSSTAAASGLQVSPVTLSLQARQNAEGLWLSNTGDRVVHAQVRVYHWTQEGGEEQLTPSRGLLVSPPMLEIAPGTEMKIARGAVLRVVVPPTEDPAEETAPDTDDTDVADVADPTDHDRSN